MSHTTQIHPADNRFDRNQRERLWKYYERLLVGGYSTQSRSGLTKTFPPEAHPSD